MEVKGKELVLAAVKVEAKTEIGGWSNEAYCQNSHLATWKAHQCLAMKSITNHITQIAIYLIIFFMCLSSLLACDAGLFILSSTLSIYLNWLILETLNYKQSTICLTDNVF